MNVVCKTKLKMQVGNPGTTQIKFPLYVCLSANVCSTSFSTVSCISKCFTSLVFALAAEVINCKKKIQVFNFKFFHIYHVAFFVVDKFNIFYLCVFVLEHLFSKFKLKLQSLNQFFLIVDYMYSHYLTYLLWALPKTMITNIIICYIVFFSYPVLF